jgi:hypothetical protein
MTSSELLATLLLAVVALSAAFRAGLEWRKQRPSGSYLLLALAALVPFVASCFTLTEAVDTSSASHPWRFIVPAAGLTLAMLAIAREVREGRGKSRASIGSVIVAASGIIDVLTLKTWILPGPYIGAVIQTGTCFALLAIFLTPERWLPWKSSESQVQSMRGS